ncbi:MAG: sigma factor-like helix-turn-helix DNA-binding protein, partial [Pseudomonadota bacterium]
LDSQTLREMIAEEVGVPLRDVEMMDARLSGSDFSLNAQQAGEEGREWVEALEDEGPRADETVTREQDIETARNWLQSAMGALNDRERMIIIERKLKDDPRTLESLGCELGLSKERIRQLEAQALKKMRRELEASTGNAAEMLVHA